MVKHKLREGEAHLLIALFDHLKIYDECAKTKDTSIADEMKIAKIKSPAISALTILPPFSCACALLTIRETLIAIRFSRCDTI